VSLRPGSVGWLTHHEFRLYWREMSKRVSGYASIIFLVVVLHLIAILVALGIRHTPALPHRGLAMGLTISGGFVLLMMISRGLITAVQALYARGDMDLMLSSPLAPRSIMTVRASFIAASVTMEFALLFWPFANVFVLFGMFAWLKAYILLPALGLLAASISLVLALLLFHLFGARRTRVIAQVMSALIAVGFMLLFQLPSIMARSAGRASAFGARGLATHAPPLDSALFTPALAVLDGVVPTLAFATICMAIFALTTQQLAGSFIRASIASASISTGKRARKPASALRFHGSTRWVVMRKELRLIARDPWLLTQLFQQSLFLFPLGVVLWRPGSGGLPIVWGAVILLAGFTSSALAWITVAAEDVPELVAAAPIAAGDIVRIKLQAALLPVVPLVLLPLLVLWRSHWWFGFSITVCALGSAASCALLNVRDSPPGKRRDFRTRGKGNPGRGLVELAAIVGWMGVCALMVWLSHWR
jgi:ABC-2 type transport system permease protein